MFFFDLELSFPNKDNNHDNIIGTGNRLNFFSVDEVGLGSFPMSRLCLGVRVAGRGEKTAAERLERRDGELARRIDRWIKMWGVGHGKGGPVSH